jgi:thioester reductase-like protein
MNGRNGMITKNATGVGEHVLLTGATGFLGGAILKRILTGHERSRVAVLVRSTVRETARHRIDALLRRELGESDAARVRDRVDVVEGDISLCGLGIDGERSEALVGRVDHVIHCAATIRFDLPIEIARRDNTFGTRNVLDFASRLPHYHRFDYVGTAYVAGKRTGVVMEDELDVGQKFWNSYERTKMEAEALVREFGKTHATCIHRPSIIVGDSKTGATSAFQGLYQVLPLYTRRLVLAIPADRETHPDLVPIDWVTDALFALIDSPDSIGRVFHLTAGAGRTCSVGDLVDVVSEFANVTRRPPYVSFDTYQRVVRPLLRATLWGKKRRAMLKGEHYLPYLSSRFVFDTSNTKACLNGSGTAPHVSSYFGKLLEFQAQATRLGA